MCPSSPPPLSPTSSSDHTWLSELPFDLVEHVMELVSESRGGSTCRMGSKALRDSYDAFNTRLVLSSLDRRKPLGDVSVPAHWNLLRQIFDRKATKQGGSHSNDTITIRPRGIRTLEIAEGFVGELGCILAMPEIADSLQHFIYHGMGEYAHPMKYLKPLGACKALRILEMTGNGSVEHAMEVVLGCPFIEKIVMSKCDRFYSLVKNTPSLNWETADPPVLAHLTHLDLSDCCINDAALSILTAATRLSYLDFGGCRDITDITLLASCPSLTSLCLREITLPSLDPLFPCASCLRSLDLGQARVQLNGLSPFLLSCSSLEHLNLSVSRQVQQEFETIALLVTQGPMQTLVLDDTTLEDISLLLVGGDRKASDEQKQESGLGLLSGGGGGGSRRCPAAEGGRALPAAHNDDGGRGSRPLRSLSLKHCQLVDLAPLQRGYKNLEHLNLKGSKLLQTLLMGPLPQGADSPCSFSAPGEGRDASTSAQVSPSPSTRSEGGPTPGPFPCLPIHVERLVPLAPSWPRLKTLGLGGCGSLGDISALAGCSELTQVDLSGTNITDLKPLLSSAPSLTELNLACCYGLVEDGGASPLLPAWGLSGKLVSLRRLLMRRCYYFSDLSMILGATSLEYLDLSQTAVRDLAPLGQSTPVGKEGGLVKLLHLSLHKCYHVMDLSPLTALLALEHLDVSLCPQVRSVTELSSCTSLHSVHLRGCEGLKDASPLAACPRLVYLDLGGCVKVSDRQLAAFVNCKHLTGIGRFGCPLITKEWSQWAGGDRGHLVPTATKSAIRNCIALGRRALRIIFLSFGHR